MTDEKTAFEGWAILELFGHVRLAGYVSEEKLAGAGFIRLDVPQSNGNAASTHLYGPSAVYALHPTTEELARAVSTRNQPQPVSRWELPRPTGQNGEDIEAEQDYGRADDDDEPSDYDA